MSGTASYQRTHKSSRLANFLYNGSLGVLIFLMVIVLAATGYDVAQQVIVESRGQVRFSDTPITGGAYFLVALMSACMALSRYRTVKRVLASIPKGYIPVGKDELSRNVFRLTASEYTRCALILHATRPTGRTLPGWGSPDTDYAGVHFRTAILQTVKVLETVLPLPPERSAHQQPAPTKSKRVSPLLRYLPLLQGDSPIIPRSLLPLLQLYEKQLENAKWQLEEPTQADYETCLRIVAVLVDVVGKRTRGATANVHQNGRGTAI